MTSATYSLAHKTRQQRPNSDPRGDSQEPVRLMAPSASADNSVRRESRRFPVGANPTRPIGRSAGSNQGDAGGNECVEVLW